MNKLLGILVVALAGCAANVPVDEPSQTAVEVQPDPVIAEQSTPRERAKAHTELAAAYYELGNMAVALDELRVAVSADPNYAPAYNVLGLVHMDLKENKEAQTNFERALQIAPNDPDANHNYGWFLCQTGREQAASKFFQTAVRNPLYSMPQRSYTLAGVCALRRDDEAAAVENFERALRLDANYLSAVLPLAQLRYRRGELDQAKRLVTQFNRAVEPTPESLWLAVRIERKLGDRSSETVFAEQLRRRFPASPEFQSLQKGSYE